MTGTIFCRSSVHESTGFSPYRLMFGEECTLPMDVGLPRRDQDLMDPIKNPCGSGTRWKWLMTRFVVIRVRPFSDKSASMIGGLSGACFLWGIGLCVITHRLKLDSHQRRCERRVRF